jgi:hypothetical protein
MHFTCSGLKVHVGHEKDMKTSAVNKIPSVNECNKTSTLIGNAYPQALQEAEYTSTHQSSSPLCPSGVQYCSLPHMSQWQRLSGVNNTATINILSLSPLDDGVINTKDCAPSMVVGVKRSWRSQPVTNV